VEIEERVVNLEHRFELHEIHCTEKVDRIYETLNRIENNIVYRGEFAPVKALVYGAASLILVTVFGSIIGLVVFKG
jgi:hypothetical protein